MTIATSSPEPSDYPGPANRTWAIFWVSILGLFLEMLLIRWVGTEIRIFAYLQNTVLVVCFLGLGLGCFTCRQPIVMRRMLLHLFVLLLLLAIPFSRKGLKNISLYLSVLEDLIIWQHGIVESFWGAIGAMFVGLLYTFLLMWLIMEIFIPIGRLLGRLLDDHPNPIWAYSVNVTGSLLGTWLFVLLSVLFQPPVTWFIILGLLTLIFISRTEKGRLINLALLAGIILLSWPASWEPGAIKVVWSPYQKLTLQESARQPFPRMSGKYVIEVNNAGYQVMLDLSPANLQSNPKRYPPEMHGLSQYDIPLLLHPSPQSYLIVGAGSGNDAAGGLHQGVPQITAVEIDPAIISLGQQYHPEKPYDSPAVPVRKDDARSFFATCQQKYDVITFGLLDSHTTTAMTNARLDHYVYTRESLTRAKSLLAEGGVLVLSFEAQKPFISDRMATVLREVFGYEPLYFRIPSTHFGWGGVIFVTGDLKAAKEQLARNPRLSALIDKWRQELPLELSNTTRVATDDWPYIYLQNPSIPLLYYFLAGLMFLLLLPSFKEWRAAGLFSRWDVSHWHFFFLGAAFLLLEVQNISKAAVVLGNTWEVNAVIVSSVLVMILLANLLAAKFPRLPLGPVYALLIGICLALYFVDLSRFAFLDYGAKALIVGGLTTLPMLFSGIVFIRSFARVPGKAQALGANLIGALVGALLQSVTFVIGIKALLLIVAGFYLLSMLTRPKITAQEA